MTGQDAARRDGAKDALIDAAGYDAAVASVRRDPEAGSMGAPKGMPHTIGGYLTWAAYAHEAVFDYRPGQVYFCTADIGWITGPGYGVYGPPAAPDAVQFAPRPPKARSGKILRRIPRKIAENDIDVLGDTSTLADPAVVDDRLANRVGA